MLCSKMASDRAIQPLKGDWDELYILLYQWFEMSSQKISL